MTARHLFEISAYEVAALSSAIATLRRSELTGDCLWLTTDPHHRTWVAEGQHGRVTLTIEEDHAEVLDNWLPVSDRVVKFAEINGAEGISLSLLDGAIVTSVEGLSAAIDLVSDADEFPRPTPHDIDASAEVPAGRLTTMLFSARTMPTGAADSEWLSPPMWMRIDDTGLTLHIDWSDIVDSRSTFRLASTNTMGEAVVAIPHELIGEFLGRFPCGPDDMVTVSIGTEEFDGEIRGAVWITSAELELRTWVSNPLLDRWGAQAESVFNVSGHSIVGHAGAEWRLLADGHAVTVSLHHGHPDTVRVAAPVTTDVASTPEFLAELNALNIAASGVRYFWAERTVHAVVDVRMPDLAGLAIAIRDVAQAAERYGTLLGAYAALDGAR